MKILVDADACPVIGITERIAEEYGIPVILLCDTSHVLYSEYSEVKIIGAGADAVDFALLNLCAAGDIVVTQDYGVAAMALGKGAFAIHQSGRLFTDENIDGLLAERHMARESRRISKKSYYKRQKKRTRQEDKWFADSFEKLLSGINSDQKN